MWAVNNNQCVKWMLWVAHLALPTFLCKGNVTMAPGRRKLEICASGKEKTQNLKPSPKDGRTARAWFSNTCNSPYFQIKEGRLFVGCQDDRWIVATLHQHSFSSRYVAALNQHAACSWAQSWREKGLLGSSKNRYFSSSTTPPIIIMNRWPLNIFSKAGFSPVLWERCWKALLMPVPAEELSVVLAHANCLRVASAYSYWKAVSCEVNSKQIVLKGDHARGSAQNSLERTLWTGKGIWSDLHSELGQMRKALLGSLSHQVHTGTCLWNRGIICYLIVFTGTLSRVWMFKVCLDKRNWALSKACCRYSDLLLGMIPPWGGGTVGGKIKRILLWPTIIADKKLGVLR